MRDLLLCRPSADIDIVCVGNGMTLAKAVAEALGPEVKVQTFHTFGKSMLDWQSQGLRLLKACCMLSIAFVMISSDVAIESLTHCGIPKAFPDTILTFAS